MLYDYFFIIIIIYNMFNIYDILLDVMTFGIWSGYKNQCKIENEAEKTMEDMRAIYELDRTRHAKRFYSKAYDF